MSGRTNADLIAETLHAAGVRYAAGIPSGQVLAIIQAIRKAGIEFVLVSHEGAAGFMADVIGRVSGVPGVGVATLGPGATNLMTGIGNAFLDRSPALAITGQVPRAQLQRRVQMRVDHQALFRPITKASYQLAPGSVASCVQEALALAVAEPPGPVHLDLPEDVATAPADECPHLASPSAEGEELASEQDLERIMELLRCAKRPLAALGFSLYRSGALADLRRFLEANHLPFVTTNMAKGVVPEDHPLWLGVVGRARRKTIENYLAQADLVVGIGYDPVEIGYEEWLPPAPLVHVDAEAADVDGTVRVEHEAIGQLGDALRRLAAMPAATNDWNDDRMAEFRAHLESSIRLPGDGFQPWQALDIMREVLPQDAILTCDVGAHTHLVATQWRVTAPETLLVSNGWSSMGYAIPAALGAKLAAPNRTVAAVMGDGCFLMMAGEMATAARLNLPIPFVVLNDSWLSLIKVKQERKDYAYNGVEVTSRPPEPPREYFGVPNFVARTPAEFRVVLSKALRADGPTVVEALVRPEIYSTILYG
ncbi:MAG TPA: thiamine pyrophosphate-binding protein [Chloroflexota bacterium]|nr:thiamine pyrophosphate-binding protein [Chloroflexota bacterium]